MESSRRSFLAALCAVGLTPDLLFSQALGGELTEESFTWDGLIQLAKVRSGQSYVPAQQPQWSVLEEIDWAAHGQIAFRPEHALFAEGPGAYPVEFFHPGKFFKTAVQMFELKSKPDGSFSAHELAYHKDWFTKPPNSPAQKLGENTRYAGFKIQENRFSSQLDWKSNDWAAFLGASYFRAIGDEYQYGASARGLAIDVHAPSKKEEFPAFTRFYLAPEVNDHRHVIEVYALLEGPSVCGTYHFVLHRDQGVTMEIEKHLFLRKSVEQLGIAPLTSMYWFSDKDKKTQEDWRPEVHDSDGLMLWTGANEHIWRPLNNPLDDRLAAFSDHNPKGYGVMQRERRFSQYQDGVHYEKRPSVWVEPIGDWGAGTVQLFSFHTPEEIFDNQVVMWVPQAKTQAGDHLHYRYRMYWQANPPFDMILAHCVRTSIGRGGDSFNRPANSHKFEIEFAGGLLEQSVNLVTANVNVSLGELSQISCERVPGGPSNHWRVFFDWVAPEGQKEPVEFRAFLKSGGDTLSETWLYQWEVNNV